MEISSDPYEQKLFQMFESCDKYCTGLLDEHALKKLCELLELHDHGSILIENLTKDTVKPNVSFETFKEALLNFLGTELDGSSGTNAGSTFKGERTLIISDEVQETFIDSPHELSDREVSPKFIVGTKKYGRRSRPHSLITESSQTDTDEETATKTIIKHSSVVQRSSSQTDIPGSRRRRPISGANKLKRCASLPAQRNTQSGQTLIHKSRNKTSQMTQTQQKLNSSVESLGNLDFSKFSHKIDKAWKEYSFEIGTNHLECEQLQIVCERVGLMPKIAERVAEECFNKLHLTANSRCNTIRFTEFISLIYDNCVLDEVEHESSSLARDVDTIASQAIRETTTPTPVSLLFYSATKNNSIDDATKDVPTPLDIIPAHSVMEMWERVGISNSKQLLYTLGFDEEEINVTQLSKVLEEELRGLEGETQTTLLKALLALQTADIISLKQTIRQFSDENKKLRADNKDANRRAALLAQEIDDRHASLEDTAKKEIQMLEQRHAEALRDLTARMASDRENWSSLTSRLEVKIKHFEQQESRLKTENTSLQEDNSALEEEQQSLQKQITDLLETNIQLNRDIADFEDRSRTEDGSKGDKEAEEVLDLMEKVTNLQEENTNLRDKNDELVSEVEALNFELLRIKSKKNQKATVATVATAEDLAHLSLDDIEHGTATAIKRRGDSPSKTRIPEESPRLGKLRKCTNDPNGSGNSESDASGDWIALNSELQNPTNYLPTTASSSGFSQDVSSSISMCADPKHEEDFITLKSTITELELQIKMLKEQQKRTETSTDSDHLDNRCKELEISLEQMQKAYEECEDYWHAKLAEERKLFEKERQIYEEEQHESDKKFTELMEKVREYEEQYSKDGRLSPIEEKDTLEQQYADLEAEIEEIRENARRIFEEKTQEIKSLQFEIEDLRLKLGESVEILTGAQEMIPNTQYQSDMESPASSPINYLWQQSTIQSPVKSHQHDEQLSPSSNVRNRTKLSTSETAIFSTTPTTENPLLPDSITSTHNISPIQKPNTPKPTDTDAECDVSSTISGKSYDSPSVASTHSVHPANTKSPMSSRAASSCSSPSGVKEELKRLKYFEISLKEQIKDLSLQRDGLVMELQQLQEARPVLEKAYARAAHPSLIQRVNQLELKNRHLQNVIKQQQQYTESLMQQAWQQQHAELSDMRNRIETQTRIMTEQTQRLASADILVKELFVENSQLAATIQHLEQQRSRANLMHQHQHSHQHQHQNLSGLPGMP